MSLIYEALKELEQPAQTAAGSPAKRSERPRRAAGPRARRGVLVVASVALSLVSLAVLRERLGIDDGASAGVKPVAARGPEVPAVPAEPAAAQAAEPRQSTVEASSPAPARPAPAGSVELTRVDEAVDAASNNDAASAVRLLPPSATAVETAPKARVAAVAAVAASAAIPTTDPVQGAARAPTVTAVAAAPAAAASSVADTEPTASAPTPNTVAPGTPPAAAAHVPPPHAVAAAEPRPVSVPAAPVRDAVPLTNAAVAPSPPTAPVVLRKAPAVRPRATPAGETGNALAVSPQVRAERIPRSLDQAELNRTRQEIVALVSQGDYEQAEKRLAGLGPSAGVNSRIGRKLRAFIALQRGDHATAGRLYRSLLLDLPHDHESRYNAALAAFGQGDHAAASGFVTPLLDVAAYSTQAEQLLAQLKEQRR